MVVRLRTAMACALVAVAASIGLVAPAASAEPVVVPPASQAPTDGLPGANDFSCVPSPEHPRPVVLVHGTWADAKLTWGTLAPALKAEGYCVFALEYGYRATIASGNLLNLFGGDDITQSAAELATFVDTVLRATDASQVDIVGHSQGGTMARQYMKFNGGVDLLDPSRNKVHTLVTLGATNHGTTYDSKQVISDVAENFGVPVPFFAAAAVGPSAVQQMVGSTFLQLLNAGGDTLAGVDYTIIATTHDTVSTPPEATFLAPGPGASVDNVWVQDGCPTDTADHGQLTTDARALWMVQRGLDRTYADRTPSPCS